MKRLLSLAAAVIVCSLAGCAGYQLGPAKPAVMADVKTIAIPTFKNVTFEPRIEVLVTDTVIKQFQNDGTFRIAREKDADAILTGKITRVTRHSARNVRGNVLATREFVLDLTVDFTITKRSSGEVLMRQESSGSTSFFISNDLQQDERQAIPLAAEALAKELVSQASEGW